MCRSERASYCTHKCMQCVQKFSLEGTFPATPFPNWLVVPKTLEHSFGNCKHLPMGCNRFVMLTTGTKLGKVSSSNAYLTLIYKKNTHLTQNGLIRVKSLGFLTHFPSLTNWGSKFFSISTNWPFESEARLQNTVTTVTTSVPYDCLKCIFLFQSQFSSTEIQNYTPVQRLW